MSIAALGSEAPKLTLATPAHPGFSQLMLTHQGTLTRWWEGPQSCYLTVPLSHGPGQTETGQLPATAVPASL